MVSIERLESVGPSSSLPAVAAVAAPGRQEDQHEEAEEDPSGGSGGDGWVELMGKEVQMKILSSTNDAAETLQVQPKDAVVVDFVGRHAKGGKEDDDSNGGPVFHKVEGWLIVVTERDVIPALELAIRFMKVGDTAAVYSHSKYAYGPSERKFAVSSNSSSGETSPFVLPPNSNVIYRVTVRSIISEKERDTCGFQIRSSEAKKTIGNDVYANEWSNGFGKQRAIQLYKRGADGVEYLVSKYYEEQNDSSNSPSSLSKEQLGRAKTVLIDCLNNIAACYVRSKEYNLAKQACVSVLKHDPSNHKALLRAAKSCLLDPASSYEEVQAAIDAAASELQRKQQSTLGNEDDDENNIKNFEVELRKLQAELKRRKSEYKKKSKDMFSRMAKDMKKTSPPAPSSSSPGDQRSDSSSRNDNGKSEKVDSTKQPQHREEKIPSPAIEEDAGAANADNPFQWKRFFYQLVFQIVMGLVVVAVTRYTRPEGGILGGAPTTSPRRHQEGDGEGGGGGVPAEDGNTEF